MKGTGAHVQHLGKSWTPGKALWVLQMRPMAGVSSAEGQQASVQRQEPVPGGGLKAQGCATVAWGLSSNPSSVISHMGAPSPGVYPLRSCRMGAIRVCHVCGLQIERMVVKAGAGRPVQEREAVSEEEGLSRQETVQGKEVVLGVCVCTHVCACSHAGTHKGKLSVQWTHSVQWREEGERLGKACPMAVWLAPSWWGFVGVLGQDNRVGQQL